jgi:hypothetical protein
MRKMPKKIRVFAVSVSVFAIVVIPLRHSHPKNSKADQPIQSYDATINIDAHQNIGQIKDEIFGIGLGAESQSFFQTNYFIKEMSIKEVYYYIFFI